MNNRYLSRAKSIVNGEWVEGYYAVAMNYRGIEQHNILIPDNNIGYFKWKVVKPSTICRCTGLEDKNGKLIWENDITKLVLSNGEVRYFKVSFKKIIRKVLCHPDFYDDVARVELNAICFEWSQYELFPCVDEDGISDVSKMEVVGNIFDNPELMEQEE